MESKKLNSPTESVIEKGKVIVSSKSSLDVISGENLKIKRHKFDSLTLFEISEAELEIIEKGSPSSIYLNFSIFLISVAVSFLISILTNDYTDKQNAYIVFLVITIIGFIIGIFLIILWLRTKNDFDETIKKIKQRIC
ncbi:hypothetical protein [uncultured Draconibacterium sp.]|uniref:hypothetical protein n=1 Tax=uncultured Draconibacterium sp. TaxID=1573823 RepID=UPI002AA818CF|nr:hypothetical protein [uncultured Draconibacterium sp.]